MTDLMRGACHQAMSSGDQYGWHSASHPAPRSSAWALLSPTMTGVPHACASTIGRPKPSP